MVSILCVDDKGTNYAVGICSRLTLSTPPHPDDQLFLVPQAAYGTALQLDALSTPYRIADIKVLERMKARRDIDMTIETYKAEGLERIIGTEPDFDPTLSVDILGLSVRARNCLYRADVQTLGELAAKTPEQLLEIRNAGRNTLREIADKAAKYGTYLKPKTSGTLSWYTDRVPPTSLR